MRKIPKVLIHLAAIVLVAVFIGIVFLRFGYTEFLKGSYPLKYTQEVEAASEEFQIPPSLIYAVIRCESSFQPEAVSHAGAKGLMQLTDDSFDWALYRLGEDEGDVFDPDTNIRCGTRLLQYLLKKFENEETALAAYNAGAGTVTGWLNSPDYSADGKILHTIPYNETATYVKRVAEARKQYQTLYGLA